jgi:hypothetical protein
MEHRNQKEQHQRLQRHRICPKTAIPQKVEVDDIAHVVVLRHSVNPTKQKSLRPSGDLYTFDWSFLFHILSRILEQKVCYTHIPF